MCDNLFLKTIVLLRIKLTFISYITMAESNRTAIHKKNMALIEKDNITINKLNYFILNLKDY